MAAPPPLPTYRNDRLPPPLPSSATGIYRTSPGASDRLTPLEDEAEGLVPGAQVGQWYDVFSTLLAKVQFTWRPARGGPPTPPTKNPEDRTGYLWCEFLDGAIIQYTNPQPYRVFDDLVNSSSKGFYLHYGSPDLWHQTYITIRTATRKVTARMRAMREPGRNRKNVSFARKLEGRQHTPRLPSVH